MRACRPGRENALVFGEGPKNPKLMLHGEAPGEQESLMGRPFVGKAGKNLDHFLALVGLVRGEIYITNVVKFRPTKTGATGRLSNRPPDAGGNRAVSPWLMAEIARVNPGVIATLGNVPLQAVTDSRITIGEAHGRLTTAGETRKAALSAVSPGEPDLQPRARPGVRAGCARAGRHAAQKCLLNRAAACHLKR